MKYSLTICMLTLAPALAVGQSAQPTLVQNIGPGALDGSPRYLAPLGEKVVFSANDFVNGDEPWVSDGTAAGTFMLGDLEPLTSSLPTTLSYGNRVYLSVTNKLWVTDGTVAGTTLLKDFVITGNFDRPVFLDGAGSDVYFAANDGVVGRELWKTDGTPAGTVLVKDILPGPSGAMAPDGVLDSAALGSKLFFAADDGITGIELWETDGTAAGTQLLSDIKTGAAFSDPRFMTIASNRLWCAAWTPTVGRELISVDLVAGASYGTTTIVDIWPGPVTSNPWSLTRLGSKLYFGASDGSVGRELWSIDGALNLTLMGDQNPGVADSVKFAVRFLVIGSRLYYEATNGTHGFEPWSCNGTAAGTAMLRDLELGVGSSLPANFMDLDGEALFTATVGGDEEFWRTDGTGVGTLPFWEINPGGSAQVSFPVVAGARVFLSATDGASGLELFTFSSQVSGTPYCVAGTSAAGCTPALSSTGVASRLEPTGFTVRTSKAPSQKDGIFFFSTNGQQANSWGNGSSFQCVAPPVRRTPLVSGRGGGGGGQKPCKGSHSLDFNAWMFAHQGTAPTTGEVVQMQFWYRDPLNTSNQTTSLSNALEFTIYP